MAGMKAGGYVELEEEDKKWLAEREEGFTASQEAVGRYIQGHVQLDLKEREFVWPAVGKKKSIRMTFGETSGSAKSQK